MNFENDTLSTLKEKRWLIFAIIAILGLSFLPYAAGYFSQNENLKYIGIPFDPSDYSVHMAMLRAGQQGDLLYQMHFTTEPHTGIIIRTFYVWIGYLFFFIPAVFLYHLARIVFGALALWSAYRFSAFLFDHPQWRQTAFLLGALGSGLGWFQLLINWVPSPHIPPLDLWFIDGYFYRSLMLFPHYSAVMFFMIQALNKYLEFLKSGNYKWVVISSGYAILAQFFNPIAFVNIDFAMCGALIIKNIADRRYFFRDGGGLFLIGLAQLPLLIYSIYILNFAEGWTTYTQQSQTLTPPFIYLINGYGISMLFCLPIAWIYKRYSKNPAMGSTLIWIIFSLVLAHAPLLIQRRFMMAFSLPVGILATTGIRFALEKFQHWKARQLILISIIFLACFSNLLTTLAYSLEAINYRPSMYYSANIYGAAEWLKENSKPKEFILASEETSRIIAGLTGRYFYFGHPMETIDYHLKKTYVEAFYSGPANCSFLTSENITWVIYTKSTDSENYIVGCLERAFYKDSIAIFKVNK